jgi:DNA polymerase-3 subunit chi
MIQADFYILPSADEDSRYRFLGKLATRALSAGHRLYILATDEHNAEIISERLWQAGAESFLPNSLISKVSEAPILIGWQASHAPKQPDLLINLSLNTPASLEEFNRIAEIISQDPVVLRTTRERFKTYQAAGYHTNMHDMRNRPTR